MIRMRVESFRFILAFKALLPVFSKLCSRCFDERRDGGRGGKRFPAATASREQGLHRSDGYGVSRVREYDQVQAEGPVVDVEQVQPSVRAEGRVVPGFGRSEEHTSEL